MQRNKVVLVGTTHTGKTSIIQRFVNNQFTPTSVSSMQAAFFKKTVNLKSSEQVLEIWDTAGQERFRSLAPMYYRDARAAIIVFDVTDANSFSKAKQWVNELKSARGDNIIISLVGNKIDLQFIRVVQANEAKQYANSQGFMYYETSAKNGTNIEELFRDIAGQVADNGNCMDFTVTPVNQADNKDSKKSCC